MVTSLFLKDKQRIAKNLIAKGDRDKKFAKNWRLISLLNVDSKILPKSLAEKLKHVLPELCIL